MEESLVHSEEVGAITYVHGDIELPAIRTLDGSTTSDTGKMNHVAHLVSFFLRWASDECLLTVPSKVACNDWETVGTYVVT